MMRQSGLFAAVVLAACLLAGCRAELPTYPLMSDAEALRTIAARQATIASISGECELLLTSADGQTVHLDGVLVAEPPDKARLQAWKFGQTVFDLTLVNDQAWLLSSSRNSESHGADPSRVPARSVKEALALLGPSYFNTAHAVHSEPNLLTVRGAAFGRDDVLCDIHRRTLTPIRFVVPDQSGGAAAEVTLNQYTLVNNVPWARSIRMGDSGGEIVIRVENVELNGEIPPGAFDVPQGAILLP